MSTTFQATLTCNGCGGQLQAELYTNLHVSRSPERREQILAGEFMVYPCPHCGRSVHVQPSLLYTDFERFKWYAVFPTWAVRHRGELCRMVEEGFHTNMEVQCAPMVRAWAPRMTKRALFGLPALREALLCDDHAIDLRALQVFKVQLVRDLAPECFHPDTSFTLDGVEDGRLCFALAQPQPGNLELVRRFGVRPEAMAPLLALGEELPLRFPAYYTSLACDWRAPLNPDLPLTRDPLAGARLRTPWMDGPERPL